VRVHVFRVHQKYIVEISDFEFLITKVLKGKIQKHATH